MSKALHPVTLARRLPQSHRDSFLSDEVAWKGSISLDGASQSWTHLWPNLPSEAPSKAHRVR